MDYGMFEPCHFHSVCGNIVIDGETLCGQCLVEWGPMLCRTTPTPQEVAASCIVRSAVDRQLRQEQGELAKPGQTCWLCEERRACLLTQHGWECASCRGVD
jgi:hypothetical protein